MPDLERGPLSDDGTTALLSPAALRELARFVRDHRNKSKWKKHSSYLMFRSILESESVRLYRVAVGSGRSDPPGAAQSGLDRDLDKGTRRGIPGGVRTVDVASADHTAAGVIAAVR